MFLYGVVNASPDSLAGDSIATTPEAAVARARQLLADGADGIDLGGQGSTDIAAVVDWTDEWARVEHIIPVLAGLGVEVSIDSWRPEVVRRALDAGATVINAADGMQTDEMWQVAADYDVPIVLPFLSGPNPREMALVEHDPIAVMIDFFEQRLADADRFGLRSALHRRPGHGVRPVELAVGGPFRLPEAGVFEPRRAPPLRSAALHRAAVEGNRTARRTARHRGPPTARVRPCALPGQDPRGRTPPRGALTCREVPDPAQQVQA